MPFENQIIELLRNLVSQGGLILFFAFLLTRLKSLKKQLLGNPSLKRAVILIFYFAGIGIMGTYTGLPVMGALANARVVGVFVGGLLGGPLVGIVSGLIAGFHRFAIDIGGFTAVACMVSTLAEGTLAGMLSKTFMRVENKWLFALLWGAAAEILQMVLILIIARPFQEAVKLVEIIGLPMIIGNAIGIAMFIAISEDVLKEAERIAVRQSHRVLTVVRETMKYLRGGLTEKSADAVAEIILRHIRVSAVSLSDKDHCLAFRGMGEDHHKPHEPLRTKITREVISKGACRVVDNRDGIGCSHEDCPLSSVVIVPLKKGRETVGTLKLYRTGERSIGPVDVEMAQGLATLFSMQIEVSEIQKQKDLLAQAELQALQSQIRPHFLFNALNTITSLIRVTPDRARELLISLSELLRRSLNGPVSFITLEEELSYIQSYLEIEQARFGEKLVVNYDIRAPKDIPIPPLVLQPILENSIKHGISSNIDKGKITISVYEKRGRVHFKISDTGVGMKKDMIDRIVNHRSTGDSIGLKNINERLEHLFGRGIEINSPPGQGTTVSFDIPGKTL